MNKIGKNLSVVFVALVLALVSAFPASAQSASKAGLMVTSGSAIGVHVPLGDQVSIRPQIAFQRSTTEPPEPLVGSTVTTIWTPGVSLLLTVKRWDATQLYVSPQYVYSRANAESNGAGGTGTAHSVHGMIGAQHTLGSRFAVFGEAGTSWSRHENTSSTGTVGTSTRSWTTRSTIGAMLFF